MAGKFYITTTLPYVNSDPHMGFALEIVHADIIARYRALQGDRVFFNTGTDEHGLKIYRNAIDAGKETQEYVDFYANKFKLLKEKLNLFGDLHFIRTTDPAHKKAAQEFWRICEKNGFITEKKPYEVKYCVGCELGKTDSELINGCCETHPNLKIEIIEEENYFFRFSQFQEKLQTLYKNNPDFVIPNSRFNEIKKFVDTGLQDFSISRLKEKMPWGVPVPGDDEHVMYVWFDALVNYISTLGWPEDTKNFEEFWGTIESPNAVQIAGKDNIRQQSAMWQAMLMAADLPPSKQIIIHGFITSDGKKMSKSLGNVVNPFEVIEEYKNHGGADALRYYLARHVHPFEDSDFTHERFKEVYNANLANGLGNLVARIMRLSEDNKIVTLQYKNSYPQEISHALGLYKLNNAINHIWSHIQRLDEKITKDEPFKVIKQDPLIGKVMIQELVNELYNISFALQPFMPETAKKIFAAIKENKKPTSLFPRKD